MKAFKKWWSEELSEEELAEISSNMNLITNEKIDRLVKQVWCEALKEVLNQMNTDKFKDNSELRMWIENELEIE